MDKFLGWIWLKKILLVYEDKWLIIMVYLWFNYVFKCIGFYFWCIWVLFDVDLVGFGFGVFFFVIEFGFFKFIMSWLVFLN